MTREFDKVPFVLALVSIVDHQRRNFVIIHLDAGDVDVPCVLTESKVGFEEDVSYSLKCFLQLIVFADVAMGGPVLALALGSTVWGLVATGAPVGGRVAAAVAIHLELNGSGWCKLVWSVTCA